MADAVDDHPHGLPWEAPAATALTDTASRADRSDIWMRNAAGAASG